MTTLPYLEKGDRCTHPDLKCLDITSFQTLAFGSDFHANSSPQKAEGGNMQSSFHTRARLCPQSSTLMTSDYDYPQRLEMRPFVRCKMPIVYAQGCSRQRNRN